MQKGSLTEGHEHIVEEGGFGRTATAYNFIKTICIISLLVTGSMTFKQKIELIKVSFPL